MRVCFLMLRVRKKGGGSHQNAIVLIRTLRKLGASVTVHACSSNNDPPPDIRVSVHHRDNDSFLANINHYAQVMQEVARDSDVLLVYGATLLWAAGLYRKSGTRPVAVYLDGHLDSMKEQYRFSAMHRIKHRLWELVYGLSLARQVDLYCAVSPYLKDRYVKAGFPEQTFEVIPNTFDLPDSPRRIASDTPRILFVGRLSFEKGPDLLIEALLRLRQEQWHARIVGEGPMRHELETRIHSSKLSDRVDMVGWKNPLELPRAYASADVLVLPSRVPEPFGRVAVDAMHAGIPVIVPEKGGAAWVAGDAGITFHNGDPDSLRDSIARILADRQLRARLAKCGRERAREFNAGKIGRELSLVLERLLD